MRAVNGFVAAGGPTGAAGNETRVVTTTDEETAGGGLLLEVALQTEGLVAGFEHLVVHRPVRGVTHHAAFASCLVLKDERSLLSRVALETGVVGSRQLHAAAQRRISGVGIMTIGARHFAFSNRMSVR